MYPEPTTDCVARTQHAVRRISKSTAGQLSVIRGLQKRDRSFGLGQHAIPYQAVITVSLGSEADDNRGRNAGFSSCLSGWALAHASEQFLAEASYPQQGFPIVLNR
jgi:hypothetical protein